MAAKKSTKVAVPKGTLAVNDKVRVITTGPVEVPPSFSVVRTAPAAIIKLVADIEAYRELLAVSAIAEQAEATVFQGPSTMAERAVAVQARVDAHSRARDAGSAIRCFIAAELAGGVLFDYLKETLSG